MTPSDLDSRLLRAQTLLAGYPPAVLGAAESALRTRDPAALDFVLHGVLTHHLVPLPERPPVAEMSDEAQLVAHVGLDSFAMAEIGFLLEDLLETRFPDDELRCLQTLGDLRRAVRSKFAEL
jgi:acyl carrier protein